VLGVAEALARLIPVVVMCYANPVFARGVADFVAALRAAAVSGLIVPDLPAEESPELLAACDAAGIALVPLIAPTTTDERLRTIAARARGFLYAVSLTGTTGERAALSRSFEPLIARARRCASVPIAVGFGIATPAQAVAAAGTGADGVIVGSRLVRAAAEDRDAAAAVGELVAAFARELAG
jgi:tryptophan synthase alpha chain